MRLNRLAEIVQSIDTSTGHNDDTIEERFVNLGSEDHEGKREHADHVWDMLQKSYAHIGGIKGRGFESKEEMIKHIPFWKVAKHNGKPVAVKLYKDKGGRKSVAAGTDGSPEGKAKMKEMVGADLKMKRSYGEMSGPALKFAQKHHPEEVEKHTIPPHEAEKHLGEPVHPTKDGMYTREIGGQQIEKRMVGTPGQPIPKRVQKVKKESTWIDVTDDLLSEMKKSYED